MVSADAAAQSILRASLSMDDLYTMLLFARRRAFAVIRTRDPGRAVEAFDAASIVDPDRVDFRDVSTPCWRAGLAAARAGRSLAAAAAGAFGGSVGRVPAMLQGVVSREGTDLEKANAVRIIDTADGPVQCGHAHEAASGGPARSRPQNESE